MRWVTCRRPFVITGGELTLEMLDLRYDSEARSYEAPLHMKALGGCFLIDDFGRQLVSPTNLLNRWIVPMESRVDYLKLHTGKTFSIPFEELVIFSTNLEPEDLMDPAFLRRLPYKIEVGPPDLDHYRCIFERECTRQSLTLSDDVFNFIVYMVREEMGLELAGYHPRFIVDQVVATCRFLGTTPSSSHHISITRLTTWESAAIQTPRRLQVSRADRQRKSSRASTCRPMSLAGPKARASTREGKAARETTYVPVPAKTTATVRRMILKSSQMLQLSM